MNSRQIIFRRDGNMVCAVFDDYINLHESPAGFGETEAEAAAALMADKDYRPDPNLNLARSSEQ